jgi:hypothetical protein
MKRPDFFLSYSSGSILPFPLSWLPCLSLVCLPSVSPAARTGEGGSAEIRRQQKIYKLLPSVTLSSLCVAGLDLHMLARWGRTGVGEEPISTT